MKTLNILPQKTSDALTLLEVDRLTIHMVLKYGIEIRGKTAENCSSLEVITFLSFLVLTLHRKSDKNCGFSEVNIVFYWLFINFKRKPNPHPNTTKPVYAIAFKCLKETGKAITRHRCLMKPMQRRFDKGNARIAGVPQKQGQ